ncbi:hypothetical protein BAMF_2490 [Bacillus amyloliquefaciens DSM 7]|uniref:Uncharacterized protein n=1 Tax=Bacillus amyloliquefaciens (strain ATCC 23350 / DSM 7 / BCRC 11601 / CCUG 28519 / NBRC 15535 / NRRL B-14393 / F) TaxID=692420 RepID=A0A9P1JIV8_BACAS|nr:hypothetical protein BAMF_2490 [Bacillus amyloliquefaciens DSM 7] [Bacillus amyloliquefaciens DSM 7 = ATCC 23350]
MPAHAAEDELTKAPLRKAAGISVAWPPAADNCCMIPDTQYQKLLSYGH